MTIYDEQWWDESRNPIKGCTKISPACLNCYACDLLLKDGMNPYQVTFNEKHLIIPQKWKKGMIIFMVNMGDMFHVDVPDQYINRIFDSMRINFHHNFFILTKRPLRMRDYCRNYYERFKNFPKNVWLGVTAEDQQRADERIPVLLDTIAYNHFVSVEPLLEPVKLIFNNGKRKLKWIITGGENILNPMNKHKARFMNPDWTRDIRDQCAAHRVPLFMKQMTNRAPIPSDLNVKQFPQGLR